MANKYYVGDVGTDIIVDCGQDITGATGTVIKYKKPDGSIGEWVATIYNSNYLKYTVLAGDWDQQGNWYVNAYMILSGWTGRGETDTFYLNEPFEQ